jgi:hypothetical protein
MMIDHVIDGAVMLVNAPVIFLSHSCLSCNPPLAAHCACLVPIASA